MQLIDLLEFSGLKASESFFFNHEMFPLKAGFSREQHLPLQMQLYPNGHTRSDRWWYGRRFNIVCLLSFLMQNFVV